MYEIEIRHEGLNKYRHIRGTDRHIVEQKAKAQLKAWDEMWARRTEIEQAKESKLISAQEAADRTLEAEKALSVIEDTLVLALDSEINWEKFKDISNFNIPMPSEPKMEEVVEEKVPDEPLESDAKYQPRVGCLASFFSSLKQKEVDKSIAFFKKDRDEWAEITKVITNNNLYKKDKAKKEYLNKMIEYKIKVKEWEGKKNNFHADQAIRNNAIDKQKNLYLNHDVGAILGYCDMVLANSSYPDSFPQEYEIDYNPDTRMLIVEYLLPNIEAIPKLKEVKYIQSKQGFKEYYLPEAAINKMYDLLLYKIALRTICELFKADIIDALDLITFNGIVRSIDKSVGKEVENCIMSIQANKAEFMDINLVAIDPKTCFKKLKGISASKLHGLSAVPPIINISKEDARFITAYGVADSLDDSMNIAAMDWQDFEHLIREIFEKEFNETGGEVRITQASRDGGVDAIAFDPDPLRGGKIAIQAKRYTNVVGVAAVRDLYGTVINEGASRGILVTTSEYGPDAYQFAKDKPIILLNGNNLLHLLKKHGHKAKIDLKEAKQILSEADSK